MRMLKYECQLCSRIHYGRKGLKAGYCTTCGPKGKLIRVINYDWIINYAKTCKTLAGIMEKAVDNIKDFTLALREVNKRKENENIKKCT